MDEEKLRWAINDKTKPLVELASVLETVKWNKIMEIVEPEKSFEEKLDSVFDTVYRSLCSRWGHYFGSKSYSFTSLNNLTKTVEDILKELGAEDKLNKIKNKEAEWTARALKD